MSTEEKAQIARGYGAEFIINYRKESIAQRVNEITSGKGVIAAFDAVGKDTYEATLQSISERASSSLMEMLLDRFHLWSSSDWPRRTSSSRDQT